MNDNYEKLTKVETDKTKSKNKILDLWKDPVISQLISNWLSYKIPILATLIISYINKEYLYDFLKKLLLSDIKLYVVLILLVFSFMIKHIYLKYFQKKKKEKDYFKDKIIGNYRFADLNNILLTTFIEVPNHLQKTVGANELDLLTFFRVFISHFNTGIGWNHPTDDGMFLYYKLGPKLISYSLCEKVNSLDNNTEENINSYDIQTSENGYKFFALLESYNIVFNTQIPKININKKEKKN
jgi:hypothetical protein